MVKSAIVNRQSAIGNGSLMCGLGIVKREMAFELQSSRLSRQSEIGNHETAKGPSIAQFRGLYQLLVSKLHISPLPTSSPLSTFQLLVNFSTGNSSGHISNNSAIVLFNTGCIYNGANSFNGTSAKRRFCICGCGMVK
jgi:hypothetical protein